MSLLIRRLITVVPPFLVAAVLVLPMLHSVLEIQRKVWSPVLWLVKELQLVTQLINPRGQAHRLKSFLIL